MTPDPRVRGPGGHEMKVSMTYILWSSDFTQYLEDYLIYEHNTWDYESI